MGENGSGARPSSSLRALKPPPDRLYGRSRGHRLRSRQERLLDVALPRLLFSLEEPWQPQTLWLEIGFGSGEHALTQIAAHPEIGLIACEVFENGICSLLSRLLPEGQEATAARPNNLRLWPDDARTLLRLLPDRCVDRLFLLFPDPWPKARHAKRRFVHPALLPLLARVMKAGAEWRVASDDPTYQAWVTDVMSQQTLFDVGAVLTERPGDWPSTRYEAKALRGGRTPLYWSFTRR